MKEPIPKLKMIAGQPTSGAIKRYESLLKQKYCREQLGLDCLSCNKENCHISPCFDDEITKEE